MSPLDRLCELLDERGVKYKRKSFFHSTASVEYVTWRGVGGLEFSAHDSVFDPDMLYINNAIISPEDAIAVTIGRGTCRMVLKDDHEVYGEAFCVWWECDECGCTLPKQFDMPEIRYCPNCGREVVR